MTENYKRGNILQWSEEASEAFIELRMAINNCPKLFWMDDTSPIFLETDASDYGFGAYLYQLVDGMEQPIGFISKSFDERMSRWDVPQKEGYAIFYALQKWEYLLRYRRFTLRTDHDNLTRLKRDHSESNKVQRWFKCFQEFDYELIHIKGSNNKVADAFSRLCAINKKAFTDHDNIVNTKEYLCPLVEIDL